MTFASTSDVVAVDVDMGDRVAKGRGVRYKAALAPIIATDGGSRTVEARGRGRGREQRGRQAQPEYSLTAAQERA